MIVGVPEITPVVSLIVMPLGSVPLEIAYEIGATPPLTISG